MSTLVITRKVGQSFTIGPRGGEVIATVTVEQWREGKATITIVADRSIEVLRDNAVKRE